MRIQFWYSICILVSAWQGSRSTSIESKIEHPTETDSDSYHDDDPLDLTQVTKQEGGLIHNVFKLLRLEISVMNSVEGRLHTRMKRAKKRVDSDRFDDIQRLVDDTKRALASQVKVIKSARKIWSAAKASTKRCENVDNLLALIEFHPKISEQIQVNGDIVAHALSRLESEKSSLFSRKLKLRDIIHDSPQRLADMNLARGSLEKNAAALSTAFDSLKEELTDLEKACTSDESVSEDESETIADSDD